MSMCRNCQCDVLSTTRFCPECGFDMMPKRALPVSGATPPTFFAIPMGPDTDEYGIYRADADGPGPRIAVADDEEWARRIVALLSGQPSLGETPSTALPDWYALQHVASNVWVAATVITDPAHAVKRCALIGSEAEVRAVCAALNALASGQPSLSSPGFDVQRVMAWMHDPQRTLANLAFTEGPERQAAYLVEMALSSPRSATSTTTALFIEEMTAALVRHSLTGHYSYSLCGCGALFEQVDADSRLAAHAAHVAGALKALLSGNSPIVRRPNGGGYGV